MTDPTSPADPAPAHVSDPAPPANLGGMLGIAACFIGLAIFLGGCAGFERSFDLAWIPLAIAAVGLAVTVIGGMRRRGGVEQTGVLASIFLNVFGLLGGLLEWAFSHGSTIFYSAPVK